MDVMKSESNDRVNKILRIREIMKERDEAKAESNYAKSDILRDKLISEFDVEVIDQKNGPSGWKFKDGSSKKLPSGISVPESAQRKRQRDNDADDETRINTVSNAQTNATKAVASVQNQNKKQKISEPSPEQLRNQKMLKAVIPQRSSSKTVQGVVIETLSTGSGTRKSKNGDKVKMNYVGRLKSNGKVFDSSKKPFVFRLCRGEVIKGWDIGCEGMLVGEKRRLTIPPEKGYGKGGAPPAIPGNATLVFEVTLVDIV